MARPFRDLGGPPCLCFCLYSTYCRRAGESTALFLVTRPHIWWWPRTRRTNERRRSPDILVQGSFYACLKRWRTSDLEAYFLDEQITSAAGGFEDLWVELTRGRGCKCYFAVCVFVFVKYVDAYFGSDGSRMVKYRELHAGWSS